MLVAGLVEVVVEVMCGGRKLTCWRRASRARKRYLTQTRIYDLWPSHMLKNDFARGDKHEDDRQLVVGTVTWRLLRFDRFPAGPIPTQEWGIGLEGPVPSLWNREVDRCALKLDRIGLIVFGPVRFSGVPMEPVAYSFYF